MRSAIVAAVHDVLDDEELMARYWEGGYQRLTEHAIAGSKNWVGAKLMALLGSALIGAGLYLIGRFSK